MQITHWQSMRRYALPRMSHPKLGLDFAQAFELTLRQWTDFDFYEFQKTPLWAECEKFVQLALSAGDSREQVVSIIRMFSEEAYAALAFEQAGRRILKPSSQLVHELLHTDVTVPMNEILPPFPSVYIELPKDNGFSITDDDRACPVFGIYVTWTSVSKQAHRHQAEFEQCGLVRDSTGGIRRANNDAERELGKTQDLPAIDSIFGDYFARFNVIAEGPPEMKVEDHNFTTNFFNMHWGANQTDEAETLFESFVPHWRKSTTKPMYFDQLTQAYHLAANLFLYMSSPQYKDDVRHTPNPLIKELASELKKPRGRRNEKRLSKLQGMSLAETYEIGHAVEVVARVIGPAGEHGGTALVGDRASPSTHWRRAHWRRVWVKRDGLDVTEWRRIQRVLVHGRGVAPTSSTYEVK